MTEKIQNLHKNFIDVYTLICQNEIVIKHYISNNNYKTALEGLV